MDGKLRIRWTTTQGILTRMRDILHVESGQMSCQRFGHKSWHPTSHYAGCFVDLRTLTWVLTNESHSLESACKHFDVPLKSKIETYGVVNPKLISYNINDVNISYLLLKALMKKLNEFDLPLYPNKLSSTANLLNPTGVRWG